MYEELREIIDNSHRNRIFRGRRRIYPKAAFLISVRRTALWNAKTRFQCTPEEIVSHSFFMSRTDDFYEYYMQNLIFPDVHPNATHYALARLEEMGKLRAVVTQNIDGLHQAAGNTEVYELHGTISRAYCMKCGKRHTLRIYAE